MQAALVGLVSGDADDAAVLSLGLAPGIDAVTAQSVEHEDAEKHRGRVDVHHRDAQRDQHDGGERHAALHLDVLEAVERHVGHHGEAGVQGDAEHQPADMAPGHPGIRPALHAQLRHQPDETRHQGRGRRGRQPLEVPLVHHAGVDVEAGEPQRRACAIDEGRDPAPAAEALERPFVGDERGSRAERHHVGQRVHLLAEGALGVGHAGHAAVEAVEHHRAEHADRSEIEAAVHGHHDGIEAAEQRCQREEIGQDVDALAALARHHARGGRGVLAIMHQAHLRPLRMRRCIQPLDSWTWDIRRRRMKPWSVERPGPGSRDPGPAKKERPPGRVAFHGPRGERHGGQRSVAGLVHELVLGDPGHHGAQLVAHHFDAVVGRVAAAGRHARVVQAAFLDEHLGVVAVLDALERIAHGHARLLVDDLGARHVLAEFGVVRDRVVHVGDAAFIDQVHDELELVQAFEIGHLGRVAGFDQRLVTHLDQFDRAAAQHGLLAEQVGLGLFLEVGLDDAGLAAAVGHGVAQGQVTGLAGLVLVHGHQVGHAAALGVGRAHRVAGSLRGHHPHVQVGAGHHLVVVHIEAVGERQGGALLDVRLHVVLVHLGDLLVGQQDHHDVGGLHGLVHFEHRQAGLADLVPGSATLAQADHDLHAAVVQVLGVCVALRAVADDGHGLALDQAQVTVLVVENFHVVGSRLNRLENR